MSMSTFGQSLKGIVNARLINTYPQRAWFQWAPIVHVLPGVKRWTPAQKAELIRIIRAKGGRREMDFVSLFGGHRALWRALAEIASEA